ncbi:MAG: hypothetical protein LBG80_17335 [Bacteroidales bacterium]|nr:hypothetical protein [Bacteroidales bacterium]
MVKIRTIRLSKSVQRYNYLTEYNTFYHVICIIVDIHSFICAKERKTKELSL